MFLEDFLGARCLKLRRACTPRHCSSGRATSPWKWRSTVLMRGRQPAPCRPRGKPAAGPERCRSLSLPSTGGEPGFADQLASRCPFTPIKNVGAIERVCAAALSMPDGHSALLFLSQALPSLDTTVPSIAMKGFSPCTNLRTMCRGGPVDEACRGRPNRRRSAGPSHANPLIVRVPLAGNVCGSAKRASSLATAGNFWEATRYPESTCSPDIA